MSGSRKYYGGSKVRDGKIRPLQATTFAELVASYFNVPVAFPMKRADFLAHPDRDTLKDGPYVCPCTFKEGVEQRNNANAEALVLAILDLDEGDFVKDFAESPETIGEALYPYNFVAFTTAKHTADAPRLKIALDIQTCPVEFHHRFVRMATTMLGVPAGFKGERESKVLSQPAFRPMQFEGEAFTAVLGSRTDGQAFTVDDLPDETEEEIQERIYGYSGDEITSGLAFLPIPDIKPEDIREALFSISPDCNYRVWTEVASAMRHQFREESLAAEAYYIFDEWSEGGDKYKGEKETWGKWKSFRPDAAGRNPITIRSLFFHAAAAGWDNTRIATRIQQNVEEWLAECDDAKLLMEEGTRRIAAMPFRNDVVEEALAIALRQRIMALTKRPIEKRTILKEVGRLRHAKKVEEDDGDMPGWLRPWCYIGSERNVFYQTNTGIIMSPEAFNRYYGEKLMPKDENDEQAKSGRPAVAPADFSLNLKKIPRVDGLIYDPRNGGEEPFFEIGGHRFVNEYRTSSLPALDEANSEKAGKWMKRHLAVLIEEKIHQVTMLDWMAFVVQFPGVQIKWAPVIQSGEGSGKTLLVDWLEAALGSRNVKRVEPGSMESNYNDWATGAQLVAFEEIWIAGKNRAVVMNKLKQCITNKRVSLNQKFQPVVTVDNVTVYIAFTNHHNGLHLGATNRRYFVLKSPLQTKEQIDALMDKDYFAPLFKLAENHGGAIRHFLLNHEISKDFDPNGHAPQTSYAREMIEASKNPLQAEIEELIAGEDPRFGDDIVDLTALSEEVAHLRGNSHPPAHYLTELNYRNYDTSRRYSVNGHRTQIWVHRDRWDEDFGCPIEMLRYRTDKFQQKNENGL